MQVTSTAFTVAEYCSQMDSGAITINREYQRSPKIWPPAARSYLIDTLILGYPMPKISLYQKTDLKSRKTIKEIVDGQQRSQAIADFYHDKLLLSGKSQFSGKRYSQLDELEQAAFVNYSITADVFVGATDDDVRQVFRRMNSYTIPLNSQEKRHATYQGEFKWYIVGLCERYAQTLKDMGVFTESRLSRMADATLFTEIIVAMHGGIQSASELNLDQFYKSHEADFPSAADASNRIENAMNLLMAWESLHHGPLMKPYNIYTLALALSHRQEPVAKLEKDFRFPSRGPLNEEIAVTNLGSLAAAQDSPEEYPDFADFVAACSKGTNRLKQRQTRFRWFCRAFGQELLP